MCGCFGTKNQVEVWPIVGYAEKNELGILEI
jgi:hypothetical protein